MSTTALVSVEEYLRMREKPYREYRDGEVLPKALPTKLRSIIQRVLLALLGTQGAGVFPELTVRISPTKYLVPDLAVAEEFLGPYPTEPVLLCCEILSPDDRLGPTFSKCEEYHAWGVPYCWMIDPVKRTAWEYHAAAEPERVKTTLSAGAYAVSLQELFSALPTEASEPRME